MPLEQVTEQFAALERLRLSLPRGPLRTSCELAELDLDKYKREFIDKYERETRRIRATLTLTQSKERYDREYVHPRIVINGRPVLRLFMYGIRLCTHKRSLYQFLRENGFPDVRVEEMCVTKRTTNAVLSTESVETSCRLQTLSCLSRLKWHYNRGEPSSVRVKPALFDIRENAQVDKLLAPPIDERWSSWT